MNRLLIIIIFLSFVVQVAVPELGNFAFIDAMENADLDERESSEKGKESDEKGEKNHFFTRGNNSKLFELNYAHEFGLITNTYFNILKKVATPPPDDSMI